MDEIIKKITPKPEEEEDYYDAEGYLRCHRCHQRLEIACSESYDGRTDIHGNFKQPVSCVCDINASVYAELYELNHATAVGSLTEACFTSPHLANYTFYKASPSTMDLLMKAATYVEHWKEMKKKNIGMLFWSGPGTGKTYIAACIANALIEQEVSVLMRNISDYLYCDPKDREELLMDVISCDLFILDDFATERGTDFGLEVTYNVINKRYESGKPMIITTNLPLRALQEASDLAHRRIYDRVLEMCIPINFEGKNLRVGLRKEKMDRLTELFGNNE